VARVREIIPNNRQLTIREVTEDNRRRSNCDL